MENTSANNKRIAKNTLLLYFRMLFMMAVSLYTSRVVLNALGVEDFGIYNVVGGVVAMFSMLSGSLSSAITRFITYELGTGNRENLKKIFSSSVTIQIGLAVLIILLVEAISVWFLNVKMNIPDTRMVAANWVFQFSILTFTINLVKTLAENNYFFKVGNSCRIAYFYLQNREEHLMKEYKKHEDKPMVAKEPLAAYAEASINGQLFRLL